MKISILESYMGSRRQILGILPLLLLLLLHISFAESKSRTVNQCFRTEPVQIPSQSFSKNLSKFSLKVFKGLAGGVGGGGALGNVVVSPLSVWSVLVIAFLAAEGETKEELQVALKLGSKSGTYFDWMQLEERLTHIVNRQKRQNVIDNSNSGTTSTQTTSNSQTQTDSNSQSDSQTSGGGSSNIVIASNSKVEQCITNSNGETICSNRDVETQGQDSIQTTIGDSSSSSSSSSGSSSSSSSGGSTTTCVNGVCQSTSNDPNREETKASVTCTTDNGIKTCEKETCIVDNAGGFQCTDETCTTDASGMEKCTTQRVKRATKAFKSPQTSRFTSKNWAYISKSLAMDSCLISYLQDIVPIDFSKTTPAAEIINTAVQQATAGHINSLVQPQDLIGAEFMLLNAVHFKGDWQTAFPVQNTKPAPFYAGKDLSVAQGDVQMMRVVGSFKYAASTPVNASVVELPYSTQHSLLVLLPEEDIGTVLENLTVKKLAETQKLMQENELEISLPRFSMNSRLTDDLKQALAKVGVSKLFTQPLNLSEISQSLVRLSNIIQEVSLDIDETGTTFSAATGLIGTRVGPAKFLCNHPFIFILLDRIENLPIAVGLFRKP